MQKYIKIIAIIVYIFFLTVVFLMPYFSFEGYSIISNTTSHLAAQGSPNAWLMDVVFISLGLVAILINYSTKIRYHQVIGGVFGLSLIMTAFFPHAPLVEGIETNYLYDDMHSFFATLTGFSFTMLAVGQSFMSSKRQRFWGIIVALIAMVNSIGMMILPEYMGLLQRIIFISAFGWLFFYMKPPDEYMVKNKS